MITTLPGAQHMQARGRRARRCPASTPPCSTRRATRSTAAPRACSRCASRGRGCCARSFSDDERFVETYWSKWGRDDLPRRRRLARRTPTATSGSSGASTTSSTSPATGCRPPRSSRRSSRHRKVAEAAVIGQSDEDTGQSRGGVRHARGRRARAPTSWSTRSASTSPRGSASSRGPSASSGPTTCPRRARARSCAGCCKRHRRGPRARRRHDAARPRRDGPARGQDQGAPGLRGLSPGGRGRPRPPARPAGRACRPGLRGTTGTSADPPAPRRPP